jgi:hypothetical protein
MNQMRTVVLYGPSLSIAAIGAGLACRAGWQVIPVEPTSPTATECLRQLRPDVILFDMTAVQPQTTISLMQECPGLLVVGVDLANHQTLVLCSDQPKLFTTDDFVRLIDAQSRRSSGGTS